VVFNGRLVASLKLRKALDSEIEDALRADQFMMFYQPQIDLTSGQVVGLEALLRWQHPTRGMLLPDAFIGAAFKRGLIDAVTKTALVQVCEQIAAWRRSGDVPQLPVSVNVSGRQFHDSRLPALVASALLKSGLPARLLVLEITEQSLVGDDVAVQRVARELSRLGVRIAIGDFHVGHASFRSLRQLGVSQIKLDAAFVKGLPDDPDSAIVVAAVVGLARRLKYQVIAEGVETREQCELLQEAGCEVGQGFFFGAPLSTDEIRAYLEAPKRKPPH
jgi:EAL domain-containing protein (putative c-di-GMP-specific phosphodiesterase class I)